MPKKVFLFGSYNAFSYQPETTAFLNAIAVPNDGTIYYSGTAYQILGSAIWTALDTCVIGIKNAVSLTLGTNNLSTKFKYIYPRIGGTATAHRYNLVTATATGTYNGGFIHDGSGALPNGSTGYMDTGYIYGSANFLQNNQLFFVLSKTNASGTFSDFGALFSADAHVNIYARTGAGALNTRLGDNTNSATVTSNSLGLFSISRLSSANYKQYQNASVVATITSSSVPPSPTGLSIPEFALSNGGSIIQYSPRKHTWHGAGLGVTDAELSNLYTAINTFEITLNR